VERVVLIEIASGDSFADLPVDVLDEVLKVLASDAPDVAAPDLDALELAGLEHGADLNLAGRQLIRHLLNRQETRARLIVFRRIENAINSGNG